MYYTCNTVSVENSTHSIAFRGNKRLHCSNGHVFQRCRTMFRPTTRNSHISAVISCPSCIRHDKPFENYHSYIYLRDAFSYKHSYGAFICNEKKIQARISGICITRSNFYFVLVEHILSSLIHTALHTYAL